MRTSETSSASARSLTFAAYASFVPIGIVNVILGPMLPTLSARWSLNYSQAGALFTAQYLASTVAVALSGVLVSRWGFRFAMQAGLLVAATAVALLLAGPRVMGIICIAAIGGGIGLAVPAANLLVAEVNPMRRSAALNVLNFCWSAGAVSSPFLVAAAAKSSKLPLMLGAVAGVMLLVIVGIAVMPSSIVEPATSEGVPGHHLPRSFLGINWGHHALLSLSALFFIYVGTENGFGGWIASYSKSLGSMSPVMSTMTPSFFYAALMFGRWVSPLLLRTVNEVRLAQAGLLLASGGMLALVLSHGVAAVMTSTSLAGLGLSGVYPITISLLSREFGPTSARVGSLMFTLANLGGGSVPWLVGVSSTQFGTLKAGLLLPLIGTVLMFGVYLRDWRPVESREPI
jgi:MFS transporter, FHS family, glucose/mannose:H+ symporter